MPVVAVGCFGLTKKTLWLCLLTLDEEYILCDGRNLKVHPDIVSDFTDMPFLDKSFKLVVFDPPHSLKVGKNSWLAKKYGKLPEDWPRVINKGIEESENSVGKGIH